MNKIEFEKVKGITYVVELPEKVTDYAKSFLALHNNMRENPDIVKIRNFANSRTVHIVTTLNSDVFKDWLSQYGEVKEERHTFIYKPYIDCEDINKALDNNEDFEIADVDWGWG